MQDEQQNTDGVAVERPAVVASTPVRPLGILAFVLEVALLCAAGLWAMKFLSLAPLLAVVALLIPLLVFWGLFLAPQARWRFTWPVLPIVTHLLFLLGVSALFASGHPWFGAVMLALTLASASMTWLGRDRLAADAELQRRGRQRPAGRRAAR